MNQELTMSGTTKSLSSSFIWKRADNYYSAINGLNLIEGLLLFLYHENSIEKRFDAVTSKYIQDYFKRFDLSADVIDDSGIKRNFDTYKGVGIVKSRSLSGESPYHRVKIRDIVSKDAANNRKALGLKSMNFSCACLGSEYRRDKVAPKEARQSFGDKRYFFDLPSPVVVSDMCVHGVSLMDDLVENKGCEGFETWGMPTRTLSFVKPTIHLIMDEKYTRYETDLFLRDKTDLFNDLRKWLEMPLVKSKV
jgi:hypothetical protein